MKQFLISLIICVGVLSQAAGQTVIMRYTPAKKKLEIFESGQEAKTEVFDSFLPEFAYTRIIETIDLYKGQGFQIVSSYFVADPTTSNKTHQFFILSKEEE